MTSGMSSKASLKSSGKVSRVSTERAATQEIKLIEKVLVQRE